MAGNWTRNPEATREGAAFDPSILRHIIGDVASWEAPGCNPDALAHREFDSLRPHHFYLPTQTTSATLNSQGRAVRSAR